MDKSQIFLTVALFIIGTVLVPLVIALFRYRKQQEGDTKKQDERLIKLETFDDFLKSYLLRNAVLDFHNNPNPKTDHIIEKINNGEKLTLTEMKELEEKLEGIAEQTDDKKKEMKARNTLELIRFMEEHDSIEERGEARNRLFSE